MKKLRRVRFVCYLMLCVSLFLTACSKDGASDNDAISSESVVSNITPVTQEREWVYVPEVFSVGDERADYGRMQPVGDTFCYVSLGGVCEQCKEYLPVFPDRPGADNCLHRLARGRKKLGYWIQIYCSL